MRGTALVGLALLLAPLPAAAAQVEKVKSSSPDALALPEDLFKLPPGAWFFTKRLWTNEGSCTQDACEGGYTQGNLVVSVERSKNYVRIIGGFRNCPNVSWSEVYLGEKPSKKDTKQIGKRIKKVVDTAAKYCKVTAPAVAGPDVYQMYPSTTAPPTPSKATGTSG